MQINVDSTLTASLSRRLRLRVYRVVSLGVLMYGRLRGIFRDTLTDDIERITIKLYFRKTFIRLFTAPKAVGRLVVATILGRQVRQLRSIHDFKIIAVAGSVGKTSTKTAIAEVLSSKLKVRWQSGNYNDPITVPLVFFGESEPNIFDVLAWFRLFRRNSRAIRSFDQDVVVVELGTDAPGTMEQFGKYLRADIGVLTAIAPEHIEFFGSIENVAREELALSKLSAELLVNIDLCASKYLQKLEAFTSFAVDQPADFRLRDVEFRDMKYSFSAFSADELMFESCANLLLKNQLYGVLAAAAVASKLGLKNEDVANAISRLRPVDGRLKPLEGIKNSIILDDSYNSAPEAALAALEALYRIDAPQKIAVLGNMNELGDYSAEAHRLVGRACDPKKVDLVVTVGKDANAYLAPIALEAGCNVVSFDNPYDAGSFVKDKVQDNCLVLIKGSQNGVFLEEAIKLLLKRESDEHQLVRQSKYWLRLKKSQFKV